ncbi:hypothetical protein GCM10010272_25580 [Streptomyces lateritius]|nr:hypothetical protein GCM10010272_25580 [Streptomyces lateritius]
MGATLGTAPHAPTGNRPRAVGRYLAGRKCRGGIGEDEVRARVATDLGLDASQVDAFMADLWHEHLGTPNDELIGYVRGLRRRCTPGIPSNSFGGARERETASYHFDELVEHIVHSHEIGINKPDPRAFHLTCDRLGVRPEDCLFIDDAEGQRRGGTRDGHAGPPLRRQRRDRPTYRAPPGRPSLSPGPYSPHPLDAETVVDEVVDDVVVWAR